MNTTVIKTDAATRKAIMEVVYRKLSKPSRPVVTFGGDEDELVISGCSTSEFASALSERIGKKVVWLRSC